MKKLILTLSFFAMSMLPALAEDDFPEIKKHYCSAQQIEVTDSTIYVYLNDKTYETDAIHVDQGGIYLTEVSLRCPSCRRPNTKNICHCGE